MSRWPQREPIGDPNDPRSFEVLIERYLEWRDIHHYSQRARGSAESALRIFGRWCDERGIGRPVEVTRSSVERYQRWLYHYRQPNGRPLTLRTQLGRLVYVRSFFKWLAKERYVLYNPASEIELPKEGPRLPVESFTREEVEQVLSTPEVDTPLGLRDRSMLEVLYATGIRRAELSALDLYDLDFDRGLAVVRGGKGGKDRVVPLGERSRAWVERYLAEARPRLVVGPDEWAVFVTAEGTRFHKDALGNRVKQILEASGVRPRHGCCHLFRHTMATLMLEGGADIRFIQEMLGHAKLETTQLYTKVSIEQLQKVHAATHPGARLERREPEAEDEARPAEETPGAQETPETGGEAEGQGQAILPPGGRTAQALSEERQSRGGRWGRRRWRRKRWQ